MKLLPAILLLAFLTPAKNNSTSKEVLTSMYKKYHGSWHKSLKFTQTTERFRNDSLINTSTWYETIVYPDLLRIDIGTVNSPNGILFRHDSTYVFRANKIVRAEKNENELIFFLGGMYFKTFDQVVAHFAELHYDLSKFHASIWKGKPVYVIGADKDDDKVNQLWIDQEKLVAVRFLKYEKDTKEEGTFEQQVPVKNAWSETKCSFYFNDKLLQTETYRDLKADEPVDMKIFEPGLMK
ncbi:hypothetical protein [Mucilaginibacter sp.]|uniref:hypothetical protein n=1 Tax=Mucilaginibacter sp. TaxID=1882438 RepID=UPI0025F822FF|nr:hypothetical protein [Mucilaginibacter sp.]